MITLANNTSLREEGADIQLRFARTANKVIALQSCISTDAEYKKQKRMSAGTYVYDIETDYDVMMQRVTKRIKQLLVLK